MNYKMIARINAFFLGIEAIFMIPAMLISQFDGAHRAMHAFAAVILLTLAISALLFFIGRKAKPGFYAKDGMICVGVGWILLSLFGALPFWFSREIPSYLDALFEIVSGFTTTGASILNDVTLLSRGIMYWRCFSVWLGGMGVLVFLLAVASLGKNEGYTMHLLRAESPGPNVGKLAPKIRRTATILYMIYIALTALDAIFLLFGGMELFDALCTAFSTAGTGGFGVRNDGHASFSPYIQNVTTVFMLLFGINFSCYYLILLGRLRDVMRDEELRLYGILVFSGAILIAINIGDTYGVWDSLRHAFFQVASIISTTGFSTANFDLWPTFSKAILIALMASGACAGSTAGGLKCVRVLLLLKTMRRNIRQMMHPNRVEVIRLNGQVMDEQLVANTNAYFAVYMMILTGSFLLVSLDQVSFTTGFTAVLSCFNNIGPGLDAVGPISNYGHLSVLSKSVLILDMLAGRLEIFPILILLGKNTWKRY